MKVIIQDPDDAIISHAASLKNAVATYSLTREKGWLPRKPASRDYGMAILQTKPPVLPSAVTSEPFRFNQAFIEAMSISIISLAQRAQIVYDEEYGGGDVDFTDTSDDRGIECGVNNKKALSFRTFRPSYEWIRSYCSQSIEARNTSLSPLEKVLLVILSLDGRTGEVLGEALAGGYDDVYPFFCALVHWSPRSFGSSRTVSRSAAHSIRSFSRSIHMVCEDLDKIVRNDKSSGRSGLDRDEVLTFLCRALAFCREKIVQSDSSNLSPSVGGEKSSYDQIVSAPSVCSPPRGRIVSGDQRGQAASGVRLSVVEDNRQYNSLRREEGEGKLGNDSLDLGTLSSAPIPGGPGGSGYIINVNCGHSGWPSSRALECLTSCMIEAGLEIKSA